MTSRKYYTLHVPCKPHILKFASQLFGAPIVADNKSSIGVFINLALEKKSYENRHFGDSFLYEHMTAKLPMLINKWQYENLGYELSKEHIVFINRYLEGLFEESLYLRCRNVVEQSRYHKGYKEAIEAFAEEMEIELEEDITFDGLKKIEYRYRVKLERRKVGTAQLEIFSKKKSCQPVPIKMSDFLA